MGKNDYTKESIKTRMFNRVAALWDIRNVDNLDPIVKLLVEALASEVFRLSGEIDDIEDRIVEKLARTFIPSFMVSAAPAHAIAHARAIGGSCQIDSRVEFVYKDPHFIQRHNIRKLVFSPVCQVTIFDADVTSLIAHGKFYNMTPRGGKEHIANAPGRDPRFNNTAWIGLNVGSHVVDLKNLQFYFEFPFIDRPTDYIRLLGHGRWSHNGKQIETETGMCDTDSATHQNVFELYDQHRHLNGEIVARYKDHFISISGDLPVRELKKERYPAELETLFDPKFLDGLRDELVWLKVEFPPAFDSNALTNMTIHVNCFPIANIYRKQTYASVSNISSVIPLEKEDKEYFLFMDSVTDSDNQTYKQVRSHQDNSASGTYVIRQGGSERFNSINARDFLEKLLDLYREESIAFSSIDRDISGTAENLTEYLSAFDRKLRSYDDENEHMSYLILGNAVDKRINLTMRYCMTNGAIGNNIRMSEALSVPEISDLDPTSVVLMTITAGGQKSPKESSQKDVFQYMLTTRDRIYTKEDIRLFCRCYYGQHFDQIEIRSGYEVSEKPKEGIIKVTRIILSGAKNRAGSNQIILERDILAGLTSRSPEGVNYRIQLK